MRWRLSLHSDRIASLANQGSFESSVNAWQAKRERERERGRGGEREGERGREGVREREFGVRNFVKPGDLSQF